MKSETGRDFNDAGAELYTKGERARPGDEGRRAVVSINLSGPVLPMNPFSRV
jgi:hypothetical protein